MGVIKQFNNVEGGNQIYVDDFKNISDAARNALASLPWTRPVAICNAFITGDNNGLSITPETLVAINGVVFGSDITATVTNTQYLYAVCEYDTTTPRTDSTGSSYYQAVTRKLRVSDSQLPSTDLSNASVFPGIGTYLIMSPGLFFNASVVRSGSGAFAPFASDIIGNGYVTNQSIADGAVSNSKIGDNAVNYEKVANGAVKHIVPLPINVTTDISHILSNNVMQPFTLNIRSTSGTPLTLVSDELPIGTTANIYINNISPTNSYVVKVIAPSGDPNNANYTIEANSSMHLSITRRNSNNLFIVRYNIDYVKSI